jgi:site-specific DNA-methyltransferase (cytosine-N4-specific)
MKLLLGDCLEVLPTLPAESVQCVITSPPYFGLREYGTAEWEGGSPECDHLAPPRGGRNPETAMKQLTNGGTLNYQYTNICEKCGAVRIDKQIGLESNPEEYVEKMVRVFQEIRRVLRDDGVVFLNLGDSYWGSNKGYMADGTQVGGKKQMTNKGSGTTGEVALRYKRDFIGIELSPEYIKLAEKRMNLAQIRLDI